MPLAPSEDDALHTTSRTSHRWGGGERPQRPPLVTNRLDCGKADGWHAGGVRVTSSASEMTGPVYAFEQPGNLPGPTPAGSGSNSAFRPAASTGRVNCHCDVQSKSARSMRYAVRCDLLAKHLDIITELAVTLRTSLYFFFRLA